MNKVFISYSHLDENVVQDLYNRLTTDGVDCFLDNESIHVGVNWVNEIGKTLKECQFVLFVLTPAFCESDWCQRELSTIFAINNAKNKKTIIPLVLKECRAEFPVLLEAIQNIDISTPKKFNIEYPAILKALGGKPKTNIIKEDRTQIPPVSPLPAKHRMFLPSLQDGFAGRVADLWAIHDGIKNNKTAVIQGVGVVMGLGGLGKTQLAVEYVHRFGWQYPGGVFWVDTELGELTMIAHVAQAAQIEINPTLTATEQLQQLWLHLQGEPVLMVLDNFPLEKNLQEWLPPAGDTIFTLVTTRRRDFFNYFTRNLEKLTPSESLHLLNSGKRSFTAEEVAPLIAAVDGLPLALELAKHYLNYFPNLSVAVLLQKMQELGAMETLHIFTEQYGNQLPTGHEKEVAATFRLSWDVLALLDRHVLAVIAALAPMATLPRRVLKAILQDTAQAAETAKRIVDPVDEAVDRLHMTFSLVERDEQQDPSMHRLLAAFVRTVMAPDESLKTAIVTAIGNEMARVEDDFDTASYHELEKVLPHAQHILEWPDIKPEQAVYIANYTGWHHENLGRYRLGEQYRRNALEKALQYYPAGAAEIAMSQSNLAMVLRDLGELAEARDLLREALASNKKTFTPEHSTIAMSQSNLALVLRDLGELAEARDLFREALETAKKSYEPEHPYIAIYQSNLALVLKDLGELAEARDLFREALAADKKAFTPGHRTIATSQSNLAMVLKALGELAEARDLLREALAADKKTFAPGHPTIAIRQSNLAMVLKDFGELAEARDLLREALAADKKTFAPGHPTIAKRQSNLAMVLADLDEFAEAIELLTQAYHSFLTSLGPEHPSTNTVKENLEEVKEEGGKDRG